MSAWVWILLGSLILPAMAVPTGPGIPKIRFQASESGEQLYLFNLENRLPKAIMFQGYLVIFQGRERKFSSWDITNPRRPGKIGEVSGWFNNGDEHNIYSHGDTLYVTGTAVDMADPANPRVMGTVPFRSGVFAGFQWPYWYNASSYERTLNRTLVIADFRDPHNPRTVREIDVKSQIGFEPGSSWIVGNLLFITGGFNWTGVSIWDLGDPLDPKLLSVTMAGPKMYMSQPYGHYIVTSGPGSKGRIGVFDYLDPSDPKLLYDQDHPYMGDYAHFQNGYLYGSREFLDKWIKFSMKDFREVSVRTRTVPPGGQVPPQPVNRYAVPLGNMIWLGDTRQRSGPNFCGLYVQDMEPDSLGPAVLYVNPMDRQVRQPLTARVGLAFDEDIDNRTLRNGNILVRPVGGAPLDGVLSHGQGVVNFTPKSPLKPNTTYEVIVVKGALKDWSGNVNPQGFYSRFATGSVLQAGNPLAVSGAGASAGTGKAYSLDLPRMRADGSVWFPVETPSAADLVLYDMEGKAIRSWSLAAGAAGTAWNGRDKGGRMAPRGTYAAVLRTPKGSHRRAFILAP